MPKIGAALIAILMVAAARTAQAQEQTCTGAKCSDLHFHLRAKKRKGLPD
jgi:hypothetical protein